MENDSLKEHAFQSRERSSRREKPMERPVKDHLRIKAIDGENHYCQGRQEKRLQTLRTKISIGLQKERAT